MSKYQTKELKKELRKEREKQIIICNLFLSLSMLSLVATKFYFIVGGKNEKNNWKFGNYIQY